MLLMDICLNSPTQENRKAAAQKIKILVKNFILNANINKEISQIIFNWSCLAVNLPIILKS